jgi:hypothetical protein
VRTNPSLTRQRDTTHLNQPSPAKGPSAGWARRRPRRAAWIVAVLAVAAVGAITLTGARGVAGYDTTYGLAWARDLIGGHGFTMPPDAPTPHPLSIILGAAALLGGDHARAGLVVLSAAALVCSTLLAGALAATLGGAPRARIAYAAIAAAALTVSRPALIYLARTASMDWVYVALVLGGVLLAAHAHRAAASGLVGLAALHRPEAWVLAVILAITHARHTRSRAATTLAVVVAAGPPLVWVGMGALFGNPFLALSVSQQNAATFHRVTGPWAAVTGLPGQVAAGIGWPATIIGAVSVGVLARSWWRQQGTRPALLAIGVAVAAPLASGLLGTAILARYVLLLDVLLVAATIALPVRMWTGRRQLAGRLGAAGVCVALAAAILGQAPAFADLARISTAQRQVDNQLHAILATKNLCRPLWVPAHGHIPLVALITGQPLSTVNTLPPAPPPSGTVVHPITPDVAADSGYAPPQSVNDALAIPDDYTLTADNSLWAIYTRCPSP